MVIRDVEINGEVTSLRLANGIVVEIGNNISSERYLAGNGRALLPGLHDHHIHLNATAAAMNSVKCGPPEINSDNELIEALNDTGDGWLRGVGYYRSVAGEIDRGWLDEHGPNRPVRIQHRSGRLWILNSLAMKTLGITEPQDGRMFDQDVFIRRGAGFPDLNPLVQKLLSYGITGVTEVTPSNGLAERAHYLDAAKPLSLSIMGKIELPSGHLKLHYHDHDLPALDVLVDEIFAAHKKGRCVAAHCVTRAELMLTLAAIEQAGPMPGDRIEHAAIADEAAIKWMKALDLIVVTQPNFIQERVKAYRRDVPQVDHQYLWRLKAFESLRCAAGSDAPFGNPDPWKAMAAAVTRPEGFEAEAISPEEALALYTKPADDAGGLPRKAAIGAPADLCLIDRTWHEARKNLADVEVIATWIGGELVYNRVDEAPV